MALGHPSVEIRFPFDDSRRQLRTPLDTTHFYWGSVGLGTAALSPSERATHPDLRRLSVTEDLRERVSCELRVDGEATPLLTEYRRLDTHAELAYWNALERPSHPFSVTASLCLQTSPPAVAGHELALWQDDETCLSWNETYQSEFLIERSTADHQMQADGLWNRHETYSPREVTDESV